MFFKKKEKSAPVAPHNSNQPALAVTAIGQIHVMPARFYSPVKKSNLGLILILIVGVLLIGGLVGAAVYFTFNLEKLPQAQINTVNESANLNSDSANQNFNQNINTNVDLNINDNININSGANINIDSVSPVSSSTPEVNLDSSLQSADEDGDNLTAAEEETLGTDLTGKDSDADGYSDGTELINGFDPTRPNKSLAESSLFLVFSHPDYSFIYPKAWSVMSDSASDDTFFSTKTVETFEVLILPNPNKLSLKDWYMQKITGSADTNPVEVAFNNLSGLRSPDGFTYYLISPLKPLKIFVVRYNVNNPSKPLYNVIFNVMVKNFRVLP
jgi:hypothetical protein